MEGGGFRFNFGGGGREGEGETVGEEAGGDLKPFEEVFPCEVRGFLSPEGERPRGKAFRSPSRFLPSTLPLASSPLRCAHQLPQPSGQRPPSLPIPVPLSTPSAKPFPLVCLLRGCTSSAGGV